MTSLRGARTYPRRAQVAELVDAHGSGPCAARREGSSPFLGTAKKFVEIYLKKRGMCIPALKVRFPKHEGKNANAQSHNDSLKKYC